MIDSKTHFAPQKRHMKYSGRAAFRRNHEVLGRPRLFRPACPCLSGEPCVMAEQSEHFMQSPGRMHALRQGNDLCGGEYRRDRQFLFVSLFARRTTARGNSRLMLRRSRRRDRGTEIWVWLLKVEEVFACFHNVSPLMAILIVGQSASCSIAAYQPRRSEPNRSLRSPTVQ